MYDKFNPQLRLRAANHSSSALEKIRRCVMTLTPAGNVDLLKEWEDKIKDAKIWKRMGATFCIFCCTISILSYFYPAKFVETESVLWVFIAIFVPIMFAILSAIVAYANWRTQGESRATLNKIKMELDFNWLAFNGNAGEVFNTADRLGFWLRDKTGSIYTINVWTVIDSVRFPFYAGEFVAAIIKTVPSDLLVSGWEREALCRQVGLTFKKATTDLAVTEAFLAGMRRKERNYEKQVRDIIITQELT